ncbi:SDR family oxidoreductase [Pseudomonadales bacterium]|nr:SDR family oxidoreductase [Pseudomonadales bacterium]MDB4151055.1 SDR family oxidoreductase [Pseudomonadales bacterium]MDB9868079.1 SDR family oxidoreductase [Pseudomonadales bacterium]MDB9917609.1 SDR family oxidoreductase [Pseudomonadales bacterium]MDC1306738.1 SDR family oxidoreductase [Pseudomonadales bacterium]
MGRVENKVALITGGAMGIGRACAERLASEGAIIVITDVIDEVGMSAVDAITKTGGQASYLHHDVTSEDEWIKILQQIRQLHGRLDILVNNAGIAVRASIFEMTMAQFQKQNAVNLDGVFLGLKHSIPFMAEQDGGSVINVSSVAGLMASPGLSAYAMTKGGVRLLSKSVAKECAALGNGVRVNSIHPGIIETAIWNKMDANPEGGENQADVETIAEMAVPGGILGKPVDIANGVLYLASDDSRYVNASELVIDHGLSA